MVESNSSGVVVETMISPSLPDNAAIQQQQQSAQPHHHHQQQYQPHHHHPHHHHHQQQYQPHYAVPHHMHAPHIPIYQPIPIAPYYPPSQFTSLYVGDLNPDVNEAVLNDLFSKVGRNAIASIHVCRDSYTYRSLGYAYVNFYNSYDAERALDTLNYSMINGRPCRIMWSHRDPTKRKSNIGNIFVKNLEKGVDHALLYDTFSSFGNILSCKVEYENGVSKGYGYVHFESQESSERALQKVNGTMLLGKQITVEPFVPKNERLKEKNENKVFFRNIDESITSEMIQKELSKFGPIESCTIRLSNDASSPSTPTTTTTPTENKKTVSKSHGFIEFKNSEDAQKLLDFVANESIVIGSCTLSFDRVKNKNERLSDYLKKTFELSLYINNIDESVDKELIKEEFSKYGNIQKIKIIQDENGKNKGYGFIYYSESQEATKAIESLNGFTFGSKQITVGYVQNRNELKYKPKYFIYNQQPSSQHYQYLDNQNIPSSSLVSTPSGQMTYVFVQHPNYRSYQIQQYSQGGHYSHHQSTNGGRYPKSNGQYQKSNRNGVPSTTSPNPKPTGYRTKRGQNGKPATHSNGHVKSNGNPTTNENETTSNNTTPDSTTPTNSESKVNTSLTLEHLLSLNNEDARDTVGSEIYQLVLAKYPEDAPKITGMILDSSNSITEIFNFISGGEIQQKIDQAKSIINEHNGQTN
eukprot:gene1469-1852_t